MTGMYAGERAIHDIWGLYVRKKFVRISCFSFIMGLLQNEGEMPLFARWPSSGECNCVGFNISWKLWAVAYS